MVLFNVAYGGTETGNGGDGLVCYKSDGSIKSVRLLDFYEAIKLKRIQSLDLGPDDFILLVI